MEPQAGATSRALSADPSSTPATSQAAPAAAATTTIATSAPSSRPVVPKLSNIRTFSKHPEQTFLYLLVLDFEATCSDIRSFRPNEIIEFPTVVINTCTLNVEAEFHSYVKPVRNPTLTKFCTELTGITQAQVDAAPTFPTVWLNYLDWLRDLGLLSEDAPPFAFVTCGDWDLKTMLPTQIGVSNLHNPPSCFSRWVNIKRVFEQVTRREARGMDGMLRDLRIPLVGRHHSGIDDSRNIATLLKHLITRGAKVEFTSDRPPQQRRGKK